MHSGILVFDGADELDVVGPYRVLAATADVAQYTGCEIIEVALVAEELRTITLGNGLRIEPTHTFETCPPLEVLVVPGGSSNSPEGRRKQQRNENVKAFIASRAKDARVTASVCTGAFLLAEAGVLAGRAGNTHWRFRDELTALMIERGEAFDLVPQRVVWDGDLVTGGGVTSGIDVALSIIGTLCGATAETAVRRALEIETPA
jgi:cyclohexyl-isocyanide hydratase